MRHIFSFEIYWPCGTNHFRKKYLLDGETAFVMIVKAAKVILPRILLSSLLISRTISS